MYQLAAAWGRPAISACSTNAVSSATTFLNGCPPVGSAVGSVFQGGPARMLACTPVEGADDRETLMCEMGGPDRWCRLLRPSNSGRGVNLVGIDGAQGVVAISPPMPQWASARARHAGWCDPKRCRSRFNGRAAASVASIIL